MSRIRNNNSGLVYRFVPDMARLMDLSPASAASANGAVSTINGGSSSASLNYESSPDLEQITYRQLNEDINAYRYDLEFCTQQLQFPDLTPQETRTVQLRILDLGHQIRHCQHRIELINAQARQNASGVNGRSMFQYDGTPKRQSTGTPAGAVNKRPRLSKSVPAQHSTEDPNDVEVMDGSSIQRLGYWMCHLCTSVKYLSAGSNRVPSAPCKWPLRDVSKMMNHYLDMHTEHDPDERCRELGSALAANRGPFEYWLTRTKTQNLGEGNVIEDCIETLQAGALPDPLRKLNRAAASFPNHGGMVRKEESVY
ncbi:hypothetical protein BX600DRAFT_510719 [Xylariales sp. PMI_506]|nr:hypothetical protein BX600DRAFT_510719 [Xylariales sp. PMI_506]